jgi:hypothetical protein
VILNKELIDLAMKMPKAPKLLVCVEVYASVEDFESGRDPVRAYTMNHDDETERRTLGAQCRNAFEGGQLVLTYPKGKRA